MRLIEDILKASKNLVDETEVFFAHSESISADLKQDKIAIVSKSRVQASYRVIKEGKSSILH